MLMFINVPHPPTTLHFQPGNVNNTILLLASINSKVPKVCNLLFRHRD